jgi:hypothetical protein
MSSLRLPLLLLLSLGACAVDGASDPADPADERADDDEVIEYRRPDAPIVLDFAAEQMVTSSHSIAFGHCEEAQIGEDDAIEISCPQKWSELAWLRIPREVSEGLMAAGSTRLDFDLSILGATIEDESVRFGLRSVSDDGSKTTLISEKHVIDGSQLGLELDASEYEIFMARGVNQFLIWPNGVIEVELSVRAQ